MRPDIRFHPLHPESLLFLFAAPLMRPSKGKGKSQSHSVMSDSLTPHGLYSPCNSPGQNPGVGEPSSPPGDLPNPGIGPRSPALQADSLPAEPPGKPKNTGLGSLSLLQWIFLTQELNQGLLHCRRILYRLSCREINILTPSCQRLPYF